VRNTHEYPITIDEAIAACERASTEEIKRLTDLGPEAPIGDIHAAALANAAQRLDRLRFAVWDGKPHRRNKRRPALSPKDTKL